MLHPLPEKGKIGLGIVTYNRPDYFERVMDGVAKHLLDVADVIWVYNDGSKKSYKEVYKKLDKKINVRHNYLNHGIGYSKNRLLDLLEDCDYIFILEDDVIPTSPKAITGYIEAAKDSGLHHLMYAHHGPANAGGPQVVGEKVAFYPNFVGAYCLFTKQSLQDCGLMDEKFDNAWEHVEHSFRLAKKHYTTWPLAADAKDSAKWLKEIPESISNSFIRNNAEWAEKVVKGLIYWKKKDPEFPLQHQLDFMLKQAYEGVHELLKTKELLRK